MSFTKEKSALLRKLSLEGADESLPLYEKVQYSEGQDMEASNAKATATESSDLLAHLLINSSDMSPEDARRVAALWTKSTDQELREFSPKVYFKLFGQEEGCVLYREVRLPACEKRSRTFCHRYGICKCSPYFACCKH